jgi:hypothetical protein
MKTIRRALDAMVGTGLILGLLGVWGCSDPANQPSPSKKVAESRRDELQKATQSGVPDKKGAAAAKGRAR